MILLSVRVHSLSIRLLLLPAVALLLWGCSPEAKSVRRLEAAREHFAAGRYAEAEVEFLNVLKADPANREATATLGVIYFDQGRFVRMAPYLLQSHQVDPANLDVRLRLALFSLGARQSEEAWTHAVYLLEHAPAHPEAPVLLAEAAHSPERMEEAEARLQALADTGVSPAPAWTGLASLNLRRQRPDDARAAIARALAADPDFAPAYSILGHLERLRQDATAADAAFAKAAELSPARSPRRLQYARFQLEAGRPERAQELAGELTSHTPDYLPGWQLLAELAAGRNDWEAAEAHLARILGREPNHPDALLLRARLNLARGDAARAVAELEQLIKNHPGNALLHHQLAGAYMAAGDLTKAAASYSQASAMAPGAAEPVMALAALNLRRGDPAAAVAGLRQLLERGSHPGARLLLADALRASGDVDGALLIVRQLQRETPDNARLAAFEGSLLVQLQDHAGAREALERSYALAPTIAVLEQLVDLDLVQSRHDQAMARVQEHMAEDPAAAAPHVLVAKIHLARQEMPAAEAALHRAIELQPEAATPYFLLARLHLAADDQEKALGSVRSVLAQNPRDTTALMLSGILHDQRGEHEAARDSYERVLAVNPRFSAALNNLAYLHSEHLVDLDKAFALAQRARELQPHEPNTADTLGWILYQRGQYAWALSLLQESAARLTDAPAVQFHLGLAHYMMGNTAEAATALDRSLALGLEGAEAATARSRLDLLRATADASADAVAKAVEKALAERPNDPVALLRRAELEERAGDLRQAIASIEQASAQGAPNAGRMAYLARLYQRAGEQARALELAREARKLDSSDPEVARTLGVLALAGREFNWAFSLLQEAARKQPENAALQLEYAEAAFGLGRLSDALAAARGSLGGGSGFGRSAEAERLVRLLEVIVSDAQPSADTAAFIESELRQKPADGPALVAAALLRDRAGDRAGALSLYERVLAEYPGFPEAQRRLAILLAREPAASARGLELALRAREAFPDDPGLALALGIHLYRTKDYSRALRFLSERPATLAGAERLYYLGLTQLELRDRTAATSLEGALALGLPPDLTDSARAALRQAQEETVLR